MAQIDSIPEPLFESKDECLANGTHVVPTIPSDTECSICRDSCLSSEHIVSIHGCGHIFHLEPCLRGWFERSGTCPNCRCNLFEKSTCVAPTVDYNPFNPLTLIEHFIMIRQIREGMIDLPSRVCRNRPEPPTLMQDSIESTERDRINHMLSMANVRSRLLPTLAANGIGTYGTDGGLTVERHDKPGADSATNEGILRELNFLDGLIRGYVVDARSSGSWDIDWISRAAAIHGAWRGEESPMTSYITNSSLQYLTVCAALIQGLILQNMSHTNGYSRLLIHAEQLLVNAQREARSTPGGPSIQHRRLLDHPDSDARQNHKGRADDYPENRSRVRWIVYLRIMLQGPGANPLGSDP